MEQLNIFTTVIILGLLAIIAELILGAITGFELFIIGIILILAGILGSLTGSLALMLLLIALFTGLYIIFGRRVVKQKLALATKKTNTDSFVGKKALVTRKITPEKAGQVQIEGEVWRASALEAIDEGEEAVVQSYSGVTLQVKK